MTRESNKQMDEFFDMGGNGVFVWNTVGLSIAILVLNLVAARRAFRNTVDRLRADIKRNTDRSTRQ